MPSSSCPRTGTPSRARRRARFASEQRACAVTTPPSSRRRVTMSTAMTSAMSPAATKPSRSSETKWKHAFFSATVWHGTASTRHGTESPPHHQPNLTSTSGELPRPSPMSTVGEMRGQALGSTMSHTRTHARTQPERRLTEPNVLGNASVPHMHWVCSPWPKYGHGGTVPPAPRR